MARAGRCTQCGATLKGRQTLYCGRVCKNRSTNTRHQIYVAQKRRGVQRKIELVGMLGGSCIRCGYGADFAALDFHHSMGRKRFELDMRSLSNRSWAVILREARKCELL